MLMKHTERRPQVGQAGRRRVQAELDARLFSYVIDLKLLSYLTSEPEQNGKVGDEMEDGTVLGISTVWSFFR